MQAIIIWDAKLQQSKQKFLDGASFYDLDTEKHQTHHLHSQLTEIIELARSDSSNVKPLSYSKDLVRPGMACARRNGRISASFSSE